jgi:REP element-mobilizing transposase RayT
MCTPRRYLPESHRWLLEGDLTLADSRLPEATRRAFEALNARYARYALPQEVAGTPRWSLPAPSALTAVDHRTPEVAATSITGGDGSLCGDEREALRALTEATRAELERQRPDLIVRLAPPPVVLVAITWRTMGGRMALTPTPRVTAMLTGIIGRAQEATGVHVFALHALTNHMCLLVGVTDCDQLADFTCRVGGQTSNRVGVEVGLRQLGLKLWHRRNRAIVVAATDEDVEEVMRYNLKNSVKEGLVDHPAQWPGLQAATYFCNGAPLVGTWFDHAAYERAKKRDPGAPAAAFDRPYAIVLSKLPGYAHLSDADYCALMKRWCDEDALELRLARKGKNRPGDPARLLTVPVDAVPKDFEPTPAPPIHAKNPAHRRAFLAGYKAYKAALAAKRADERRRLRLEGYDPAREGLPPVGWQALSCASPPETSSGPPAAP